MTTPNPPMNLDSKNPTAEAALAAQLAAGTQMHFSTMPQMIVGGTAVTPTQAETRLNALAALRNDVTAARIALQAKLAAERAEIAGLRTFLVAYVAYVRGTVGNTPDVLADFGLLPRKAATPLTGEQQAAAAAKRRATRQARGTKGKRARLAVKGNVTGVVVTPLTK